MLRSFRLANHRSFRDEQELLLMPSYDNDRDVVPVAAVFGANASGKSNLLDGLRLMYTLVGGGWQIQEPESGIPRSPFRLEPKSLLEPSSFAVELVLDGVRYAYGFAVDDERIIREWLHAYPRNRKRVLFDRDGPSIDFGATVTPRTRAEVIENLMNEDTLFLAVAARLKLDQYLPVIDWFRRSLLFVRSSRLGGLRDLGIANFIERSARNRTKFLDLARVADAGISSVAVEYVHDPRVVEEVEMLQTMTERLESRLMDAGDESRDDLMNELARARSRKALREALSQRPRLLLIHGEARFEFSDESAGTQLWLALLPQVITSLGSGRTLVIDEIDASLHPLLVRKLVAMFRDSAVNVGRAQLLFTTHDAFLLAPVAGEPGVERDQVWFVEKHPDGASELYPLTDFKPRTEHNLARRYLGGAYGAVPILDGFDLLGAHVAAD